VAGAATIAVVLFFFEVAFFALAIVAIALAELWGRGQALAVWAVVTAGSLIAAPIARARLARRPPTDRTEEHWRRTLADSWRHLNKLLLVGLAALAGWWWLGTLRV
jgi:ABC-type protease/lipase transport system fused ATPase/permease subunit